MGIDSFGASGKAPELFREIRPDGRQRAARSTGIARWLEFVTEDNDMAVKVGINGYGRIGRNVLRALYEADRTRKSRSSRSTISATRRPMRT